MPSTTQKTMIAAWIKEKNADLTFEDFSKALSSTNKKHIPNPDPVIEATNQALLAFIDGNKTSLSFDHLHPWTQRLQTHPYMKDIKADIQKRLRAYCVRLPTKVYKKDSFNLNNLTFSETLKWLGEDIISWITNGELGQDRAFIFGSFRFNWYACQINCRKKEALVKFQASDLLHLKSATRIPLTKIGLPDEPFGKGKPFNNVPIEWKWSEKIAF